MNSITKETRRESYDAILPKVKKRSRLILETLGDRQMTASEITEELVAAGKIPYFNRNYVAPRLTELKDIGVLETVGRRKATRSDATDGRIDLHEMTDMETEQARTYLKSIHGVGNKVADCVLLFGLHRVEAFPVDTWIRQVIDEHYGGKFPVEHYDGHAGIIQQFIFYYMQQHKGGKTT